jgi:hypothetical protein
MADPMVAVSYWTVFYDGLPQRSWSQWLASVWVPTTGSFGFWQHKIENASSRLAIRRRANRMKDKEQKELSCIGM